VTTDTKARSAKDVLLELAQDAAADYFHDGDRAYATVELPNGGLETMAVRSAAFRVWLSGLFYDAEGKSVSEQALREVSTTLEAKARREGQLLQVHTRVAKGPTGLVSYLDLGDEDRQVVYVTPAGYKVEDRPAVRFRRPRGMKALADPRGGGQVADLAPFVNVKDDGDLVLLMSWLLMALRPAGPYPVLCLRGEQGSAKSTTAKVLRALVDPNRAPLRSLPRDERDLFIAATNSWVVCIDNVSDLPQWLSDALCRLATGGGFTTRELYSDQEEMIFDAQRPVILTGISDFAASSDLRDRAIFLDLPEIEEGQRRTERVFWRDFDEAAPKLLGALLNLMVVALGELPKVRLDRLPRMADFAQWGVAVARATGRKGDEFLAAYEANRRGADAGALENAVIVAPLLDLLRRGKWVGTCPELLTELTRQAGYEKKTPLGWPQTARALSGHLLRLTPILRRHGVEVEKPSVTSHRDRRWQLRMAADAEGGGKTAPTAPTAPGPCGPEGYGGAVRGAVDEIPE
jgi:hypothetical protein